MIAREQEEKAKIENDIRILNERLQRINESLMRRIASRDEYDRTIQETEVAYMKVRQLRPLPSPVASSTTFHAMCTLGGSFQILESSQTLLHVLKRETSSLTKKYSGPPPGSV